ncbi:hypothetical protein RhiirC2_168680 [Rhizophagus irregularis]|uniref:Uncharacterized protein n=1 Tax=Rhizophagus irregularis TaxID=588596 RepID=A0A2N1NR87_9GLOM|nr:hypothetical protein RhiirC2_168680 [Rhizophagus irregularis]
MYDKMLSITKETFKLTQRQRTNPVFISSFIRENYHFKIWSSSRFPYKKYHWKTKSVPETSKPKKISQQKVPLKVTKEEKSKDVQILKSSEVSKHKIVKRFQKKELTQSTPDIKEPEIELSDIVELSKSTQLQVGDFVDVRR